MKIGLLSDTHTRVDLAQDIVHLFKRNGVEFIIHSGDIGKVEVLDLLKDSDMRYVAVYGNNDAHLAYYHRDYNLVQEPYYFLLAKTKFKLMHLPYYLTPDSEIVIYGHTHLFEAEKKANTLYINPGEACARNKAISSCAILQIQDDELILTRYTKEKKDKKFHHETTTFTRSFNAK